MVCSHDSGYSLAAKYFVSILYLLVNFLHIQYLGRVEPSGSSSSSFENPMLYEVGESA